MSYCVNCGVELADTEKSCPLCGTEVINPRAPWTPPENAFFADRQETLPPAISRRYAAKLICILLSIPVLVVLMCDVITSHAFTWSLYVVGGIILAFVWLVLPMYSKRYIVPLFLPLNALAAALFLLLVETRSDGNWFLSLGLPLCIAAAGFAVLWATLFKNYKVTTLLVRLAVLLFSVGVFIVLVELIINAYLNSPFIMRWSQYVLIPCSSLTLALLFIDSRKGLKEAMRRRLFIK